MDSNDKREDLQRNFVATCVHTALKRLWMAVISAPEAVTSAHSQESIHN